jgi:hypothetical protein
MQQDVSIGGKGRNLRSKAPSKIGSKSRLRRSRDSNKTFLGSDKPSPLRDDVIFEELQDSSASGSMNKQRGIQEEVIRLLARMKSMLMNLCGESWKSDWDEKTRDYSEGESKPESIFASSGSMRYKTWMEANNALMSALSSGNILEIICAHTLYNQAVIKVIRAITSEVGECDDSKLCIVRSDLAGFTSLLHDAREYLQQSVKSDSLFDNLESYKLHAMASSIHFIIQENLCRTLENLWRSAQRTANRESALSAKINDKLSSALERIQTLNFQNTELRNEMENLRTNLSYHRVAAERLRRVEQQLESTEREKNAAEAEVHFLRRQKYSSRQKDEVNFCFDADEKTSESSKTSLKRVLNFAKETSDDELNAMDEDELTSLQAELEALSLRARDSRERKLRARAEALEKHNEENSNLSLCCICRESVRTILILPCRHLCVCESCSECSALQGKCPVCRGKISDTIKVFCS